MFRLVLLLWALLGALSTTSAQDFRVQIAAYADSMPSVYFSDRNVTNVFASRDQLGVFRYFAGTAYNTRDEAEKVQKEVIVRGFPFAQIIDLAEQRLLCGGDCPYFTPGRLYYKQEGERDVFFDFGRYSLTSESKTTLNEVAQVLKENPKQTLQILGHSDAVGDPVSNMKLSATRARSVRNYLINKGIRADRMYIKVFGESKPAAENVNRNESDKGEDSPENRKLNRRVALLFSDENGQVTGAQKADNPQQ